jgi:transcriptional regulator with XRE-family HTH domain
VGVERGDSLALYAQTISAPLGRVQYVGVIMVTEDGLRLAIGPLLRKHRSELGLSQAAFAEQLGISQSYLSRLEREQRSAVSLALWDKIRAVVNRPELYVVDALADELDEAYDRALISYGAGDYETAEVILESISQADESKSLATADLVAKARFWLASIRRDRNELQGESGAEALYRQVLTVYRSRYPGKRVLEVQFVLGACREMSKAHSEALGMYRSILFEAEERRLDRIGTRVTGRIGALCTKLGDITAAESHLTRAVELSIHLEDGGPYSYYREKLAILQTRKGQLDKAYESMAAARSEVGPPEHLRRVQSQCVEANIYLARGETDSALAVLRTALAIAKRNSYRHQEAYVRALLEKAGHQ